MVRMNETRSETFSDELLGFSIPSRNARGRAVRLGPVLEDMLAAHDYPPALKHRLWPKRWFWPP